MPLYTYECSVCHTVDDDVYQSIHDGPHTTCPHCHALAYGRVPTRPHVEKEFAAPIEMHSIAATTPDEVEDFARRCPDIEMSRDPSDPLFGVPIARTRKQKLAALDAVGFEEKN